MKFCIFMLKVGASRIVILYSRRFVIKQIVFWYSRQSAIHEYCEYLRIPVNTYSAFFLNNTKIHKILNFYNFCCVIFAKIATLPSSWSVQCQSSWSSILADEMVVYTDTLHAWPPLRWTAKQFCFTPRLFFVPFWLEFRPDFTISSDICGIFASIRKYLWYSQISLIFVHYYSRTWPPTMRGDPRISRHP